MLLSYIIDDINKSLSFQWNQLNIILLNTILMKTKRRIYRGVYILMGFVLICTCGCKKDKNNPSAAIVDLDGNVYTSVSIGAQVWMVENMRATELKDGTPINLVTDGTTWGASITAGYCWYNNNEVVNKSTYGAIYNWTAALNVCPVGWHLPTDEEWKILERNQNMNNSDADATGWRYSGLVGGKLKESGTLHWTISAAGTTNTSGFTALPAGDRDGDLGFIDLGNYCFFWSATADGSTRAWYRRLNNDNSGVHRSSSKQVTGYSVRCLKDLI